MEVEVTLNYEKRSRCVYRNYEGDEAVMNEHLESQQSLYDILIDFENKEVHKFMSGALDSIDVDKVFQEQVITEVTSYVRSWNWENTKDSKKKRLIVDMYFISIHYHDERDVLQQSIMEAEEDCEMTPASLKAIWSLKRTRINVEDGEDVGKCMVCLEDFCDGEKVTCMPCLHQFHGVCITKWLLRSHVCPVCRYQMPKAYKA